MAFLSDASNRENDSTTLEDFDYNEFLSDAEATETEAVNYEIPSPPLGVTVTVHLDDEQNELKKIRN